MTTVEAPPAASLVLEVRNVCKSYGAGQEPTGILSDITFTVGAGEIVGLQGPSGCGKSTLLRLLMTIERPTSGEVYLDGNLVTGPQRDGSIMPIFQNAQSSLDPRWPVWKTITEPLVAPHRGKTPSRSARRTLAQGYLGRIGMESVDLSARPRQLSGGQCQRLAILRALIAQPRLLVADEPTSALDVSVAAGVLHLLREVADRGVAIVLASHDRHALAALCDRTIQLDHGQMLNNSPTMTVPAAVG
jgi:peptide/nickel transport system ATP-binding protein